LFDGNQKSYRKSQFQKAARSKFAGVGRVALLAE
jgi:hypothetical protein